jgi:hypothetical protein
MSLRPILDPVHLDANGDARIAPVPKNPPIGKEPKDLERRVGGRRKPMRLVLKCRINQTGLPAEIVSPDGMGVEVPIAITQKASSLTIDVVSVGVLRRRLEHRGTELARHVEAGTSSLPLTFRLAGKTVERIICLRAHPSRLIVTAIAAALITWALPHQSSSPASRRGRCWPWSSWRAASVLTLDCWKPSATGSA